MEKYKGPLIALSTGLVVMFVLIILSALVNLPTNASQVSSQTNNQAAPNLSGLTLIGWLILLGGVVSGVIWLLRDSTGEEEDDSHYALADTRRQLQNAERIIEQMKELFGTTDIKQITAGIQAMYSELEEHRARGEINSEQDTQNLAEKTKEQESAIEAITSERDQARAALSKWQTKAVQGQKEISSLRQKLKKVPQSVEEEELTAFFATVTLKDGNSEDAFLSSKRRQRRLMQRLRAEGLTIMRSVE